MQGQPLPCKDSRTLESAGNKSARAPGDDAGLGPVPAGVLAVLLRGRHEARGRGSNYVRHVPRQRRGRRNVRASHQRRP